MDLTTPLPAAATVSGAPLLERLAALRTSWTEAATELVPDADGVRELLDERLLALGSERVPAESDLLRIAEDAAHAALRTVRSEESRALSRRLRRAVYEFLLAVDAATTEAPAAVATPTAEAQSATPSRRGAVMIGLEEVASAGASSEADPEPVESADTDVSVAPAVPRHRDLTGSAFPLFRVGTADVADEAPGPDADAEEAPDAPEIAGVEVEGGGPPLGVADALPPPPIVEEVPPPPPAIQHDTQWRARDEWPPLDHLAALHDELLAFRESGETLDAWARPSPPADAWAVPSHPASELAAAIRGGGVAESPSDGEADVEPGDAESEVRAAEVPSDRPQLTVVTLDVLSDEESGEAPAGEPEPTPYVVPSYRAWADVVSSPAPEVPVVPLPPPAPAPAATPRRGRRLSDIIQRPPGAPVEPPAAEPPAADEPAPPPVPPAVAPVQPAAAPPVPPAAAPAPIAPLAAPPAAVGPEWSATAAGEPPAAAAWLPAEEPSPWTATPTPPVPAWGAGAETPGAWAAAGVEHGSAMAPVPAPGVPATGPVDLWTARSESPASLRAGLGWDPVTPPAAPPQEPPAPTAPAPDAGGASPEPTQAWNIRTSPRQQMLAERMAQRRREDVARAAVEALGESGDTRKRRGRGSEPMRLQREEVPPQVEELLRRRKGAEAAALLQRAAQELGGREVADLAIGSGERCRALGQVRAALNCYLAAWRADPLYEDPLWRLADTCLGERQVDLAAGYYERIADLLRARGDDQGAMNVYRKIVSIAPDRRDIRDLLRIAALTGRFED